MDLAWQMVVLADEGRDEDGLRCLVDIPCAADLLDHAVIEHRDPVGHGQRLILVVRDIDDGDAELVTGTRYS